MVHPGGFEPPTARFVAEYSIQLSYGCIGEMLSETVNGASGRIRTSDRSVRSRVLYPAELRMHQGTAFRNSKWCIREDSNLRPLGS
jgi:hypothetical protein